MADLIIYGASDDLIELDGVIRDELDPPYGAPAHVSVTVDGRIYATVTLSYDQDGDGEWRILVASAHDAPPVRVVRARGEDAGSDQHGCPGYSDKAIVDMASIDGSRIDVSVGAVA